MKRFLIVGVGRSGTTSLYSLLQKMFSGKKCKFVYEPFLWDQKTFDKPYDLITNEDWASNNSISVEGIFFNKQIPLFSKGNVSCESESYIKSLFELGENELVLCKMIRGCGRLDLIRSLIPDIKIIYILRNPVDVINSSINMFSFYGDDFHPTDKERFSQYMRDSENFSHLVDGRVQSEYHYWEAMNESVVESFRSDRSNVLPICYENYVKNSNDVVKDICEFIGVDFELDFLGERDRTVGPVYGGKSNLDVPEYSWLKSKLKVYEYFLDRFELGSIEAIEASIIRKYESANYVAPPIDHYFGYNALTLKNHLKFEIDKRNDLMNNEKLFTQSMCKKVECLISQVNDLERDLNQCRNEKINLRSALKNSKTQIAVLESDLEIKSKEIKQLISKIK